MNSRFNILGRAAAWSLFFSMIAISCGGNSGKDDNQDNPLDPVGDRIAYPKKEGSIRLVTYNVGTFSKEMTSSCKLVSDMMKEVQADAVGMNELDKNNQRHNYDQLAEFAGYMGWMHFFGKAMDYRNGEYGNGMAYSKDLQVVDQFVIPMPKVTGSEDRSCVVVEFRDFVFACTHLEVKTIDDRLSGIRILTDEIRKRYGGKTKPVFMGGDMNSFPGSEPINLILENWELLTPKNATFPASEPRNCADMIFALKNTGAYEVTFAAIPRYFYCGDVAKASDHLPAMVDISIK